jgi:hypothetical protein
LVDRAGLPQSGSLAVLLFPFPPKQVSDKFLRPPLLRKTEI